MLCITCNGYLNNKRIRIYWNGGISDFRSLSLSKATFFLFYLLKEYDKSNPIPVPRGGSREFICFNVRLTTDIFCMTCTLS